MNVLLHLVNKHFVSQNYFLLPPGKHAAPQLVSRKSSNPACSICPGKKAMELICLIFGCFHLE